MFPLSETSTQGSLFANMALCSSGDEPRKASILPQVLKGIDQLVCLTGIYPGSLSELKLSLQHFAKEKELSATDKKALALFINHFVQNYPRALTSRTCRTTLVDALEQARARPPLSALVHCLAQVISLTGLSMETWRQWDYHFQHLYPREGLPEQEIKAWIHFWDFVKKQRACSSKSAQSESSDEQESWSEQLERFSISAGTSSRARLSKLLQNSGSQPLQRAETLQTILNALLTENLLMNHLRSALFQMRQELGIGELTGADRPSIPDQVEVIHHLLMQSVEELDEGETSSEFALFLHVHARTSGVQSKCYLQRLSRENYRENLRKTERALARLSALKAHLREVLEVFSGPTAGEKMGPLILILLDYVATISCKFKALKFITVAADLFHHFFAQIREISTDEDLSLTPAIELALNVLKYESSSQEGLVNLCQIEELYERVEISQKELYRAAKGELDAIASSQERGGKRAFLKFYKCLIELPGAETTIPASWPVWREKKEPEATSAEFAIAAYYPPKSPIVDSKSERDAPISQKETAQGPPSPDVSPPGRSTGKTPPALLAPEFCFPFPYHSRVTRWLRAKIPLDGDLFPEYALRDPSYQRKMIFQHNFPLATDQFWRRGAQQPFDQIKDRGCQRYMLPAELIADSKSERGMIVWSINRQGICYHRFFHPKSYREICDKTMHQTFTDADFPEMSISREIFARESKGEKLVPSQYSETCTVQIDKLLNIATLHDRELGITLRLFLMDFDR